MTDLINLKRELGESSLLDDVQLINDYRKMIQPDEREAEAIYTLAARLTGKIRSHEDYNSGLDAFMAEYNLDTEEGIRLMTLAEALIRIPDDETRQALIKSKLTGADWADHIGKSLSPFVNSSTRALLFTSSILEAEEKIPFLAEIIKRLGEPGIRMGVELAMKLFSHHFVMAEELQDADKALLRDSGKYRYSFDMLGEAALSMEDADRYFKSYMDAIIFAGQYQNAAVSIKLSALHPRFDILQEQRVRLELFPRLVELFIRARDAGVQVTIDAEEADRLELVLDLVESLFKDGRILGWHKLGLAVQAYSKRAMSVIRYLQQLARQYNERIYVRLVKGAYWDTEVKQAQIQGLSGYPVYTIKSDTDIAYLACARYLIESCPEIFPQFATHNVQTVATLLHWTQGKDVEFEFQRLHGMGDLLYESVIADYPKTGCCIYAPVGRQKELLPYLIRRLLENTANSSFVNKMARNVAIDELVRHPADIEYDGREAVRLPRDLYLPQRINSAGINLRLLSEREALLSRMKLFTGTQWKASPSLQPDSCEQSPFQPVYSPVDNNSLVGEIAEATEEQALAAVATARQAFMEWKDLAFEKKKSIFLGFAEALETNLPELIVLMARETGKTVPDSLAEIREAVDFVRYYTAEMELHTASRIMPGPNGERNELFYEPRGVVLCISPWNFPVAIFVGQIIAALATGNTVVSKPAEEASLVGFRICQLFFESGLPEEVLQFVPGSGEEIGDLLTRQEDIDAVVFTGSVEVSRLINRNLASRKTGIIPLIAETGGQNVMFADSSALPEQVVKDVLASAFNSAGQRCSALRVLFVQESSAEEIIRLLKGAVAELSMGDPLDLAVDMGPVITDVARRALQKHIDELDSQARLIYRGDSSQCPGGWFVAPHIYEIESIQVLKKEHFGPILHLIRYRPADLPEIIEEINEMGYGLTLGIHSRNDAMINLITRGVRAGNKYVNRNMIGAVVESQPFGGVGLSGTGPKAGGPDYLRRFMFEVSISTNTAAMGGAVDLINQ